MFVSCRLRFRSGPFCKDQRYSSHRLTTHLNLSSVSYTFTSGPGKPCGWKTPPGHWIGLLVFSCCSGRDRSIVVPSRCFVLCFFSLLFGKLELLLKNKATLSSFRLAAVWVLLLLLTIFLVYLRLVAKTIPLAGGPALCYNFRIPSVLKRGPLGVDLHWHTTITAFASSNSQ